MDNHSPHSATDSFPALRRWRRAGLKTPWLCRFFTWFWFNRENRNNRWPTKVVHVLGPSTFRVENGGSRKSICLRGEGCHGYEYPRQTWISIGEWLRRYRWFLRWNRDRCAHCDHDVFEDRYTDMMGYQMMENVRRCAKCKKDSSQWLYGDSEDWTTNRWLQYEEILFGPVKEK